MTANLRDFLGHFQRGGIEVCVSGTSADLLFGVRDAFRRFFHDGLERPVPVAVVPQESSSRATGLASSDGDAMDLARKAALALEARLPGTYHFYVAGEPCVHVVESGGRPHWFVRYWSAVAGVAGVAFGSSGSIQFPDDLVDGISSEGLPATIPGTRRGGGIIASLTGGLEGRREAISNATLHALSTQFYGVLEGRPESSR
ncbi:MAG: DUF84 family protein [Acidobacteria bacterium]|nr:DUF84 family protein [Acidobacteriota bacterium]